MQNFSLISPKLCLLSQKNTGMWSVNTLMKKEETQVQQYLK